MKSDQDSRPRPILPLALLAVGLLAGIVIGRLTGGGDEESTGTAAAAPGRIAASAPIPSARAGERSKGSRSKAAEALRSALGEPDPLQGSLSFALFVEGLGAPQFEEAAKALWATPGKARELDAHKRLFAYRWGQVGGAEAVGFAAAGAGEGKVAAISAALAGWASTDPVAARAWIDGQDHPGKRLLYGLALVDGWAHNDLAGATEYVLASPGEPQAERMMRSVAGEHVRQDSAGAGPWALGLPEGALRNAALDEVATRWVWADGPAAIDWVAALPDSGQMPATMNTAMGIWTRTDPASAAAHLETMPNGAARDHAVGAFSRAAAAEDPETSAAWAATIIDPTLRENSLTEVARSWLARDPEAARAWLAQSGLSQELQALPP